MSGDGLMDLAFRGAGPGRLAAAVLVGITLSLLVPGTSVTAAPSTTVVTLRVPNCEGCQFSPRADVFTITGEREVWEGPKVTVRNGKARFSIPTRFTSTMTMEVDAPWQRNVGAAWVVLSASTVSELLNGVPQPQRYCWDGTKRARATLRVTVVREERPAASYEGEGNVVYPMAYLSSLPRPEPFSTSGNEYKYCLR